MSDNTQKQKSGQDFKVLLADKFTQLRDMGIIKGFKPSQDFTHIGFEYQKQYKASFIIETLDEKFIIICSSTSYKSDRHNQYNWNIQGILQNSEISDKVVASVILYSNKEKDNGSFLFLRNAIASQKAFSPASHLLTVDELLEFLENYTVEIQSRIDESDEATTSEEGTPQAKGSAYGKKGFLHEKQLVTELNNTELLAKFKAGAMKPSTPYRLIMSTICEFNTLSATAIYKVVATDTVPLLQSGGNAKTDIIISVHTNDDVLTETLSVKTSTKNRVSCHDYAASSFIRVLDCEGTKLAEYFHKFQACPTYTKFEAALADNESLKEFETLLAPHTQKLSEWALSGAHDIANFSIPEIQVSKYLFVQMDNEAFCHDMNFYIQKLFESMNLKYGIPFSWTYPSKQEGKRIQLKVPLKNFG